LYNRVIMRYFIDDGTECLDLNGKSVQVQVREDGRTVWVNVDGICRLRASAIPELEIEDSRTQENEP
jgi:hypothetical protein